MAGRLEVGEPVGAGLKRLLLADVAAARREVETAGDRAGDAVHRARRHLKRARSLLRVFRPVIGDDYADRRDRLGEAADLLAPARDADAALTTARSLAARSDEPDRMAALLDRLAGEAEAAHRAGVDLGRVAGILRRAEADAAGLPRVAAGEKLLTAELVDAYRLGRRDWRDVGDGVVGRRRGEALLHDWRKRVKHRWHLTLVIGPFGPATSRALAADLDRLAEWLGDEHDLALLSAGLLDDPARAGGRKAAERILEAALRRRRKLERRALELGQELYGAKTSRFEADLARSLASPVTA